MVIREKEGERVDKDFIFPCGQWLDDHEGDCKTERDLYLAGSQQSVFYMYM